MSKNALTKSERRFYNRMKMRLSQRHSGKPSPGYVEAVIAEFEHGKPVNIPKHHPHKRGTK